MTSIRGHGALGGTRREPLLGLAGMALFLVGGCAIVQRPSDLDEAQAELEELLDRIDDEGGGELASIAEEINQNSRKLLEAHRDFASEFNFEAADRSVSQASLVRLADAYDSDRRKLRDQLLRSQDELHAAVPQDEWPEVLAVLNAKSRAVLAKRGRS